jgi:hypothetical protein
MRGFLLLLAGAASMALSASAGACTPEGLQETMLVIKPAMLGCAIDAHVYGGKDFHCSNKCAEDLDRSLLTSDSVFDCVCECCKEQDAPVEGFGSGNFAHFVPVPPLLRASMRLTAFQW